MADKYNWLQRNVMMVLITLGTLSLLLMSGTVVCSLVYLYSSLTKIDGYNISHRNYLSAYGFSMLAFFGAANGMIIFRVFALNLTLVILHAVLHLSVLVSLVLNTWVYYGDENRNFFEVYQFPNLLLISCFILQICAALFLVVFQTGTTYIQRQKRAGIHCLMGLITFTTHLWNILLNISMLCSASTHTSNGVNEVLWAPLFMGILIYLYSLIIIVILLTPYFEAEYRAAMKAVKMARESKQKEKKTFSISQSAEPT